jgi:hypothetical protein
MEEGKTLYIWCMLNNIRPLDIKLAFDSPGSDDFMIRKISLDEFKDFLKDGNYKENSTPRKPNKFLELRMYGFVPYNISEIQKGIQFGHAVARYGKEHMSSAPFSKYSEYVRWVDNWETFIILNGGTSNEGKRVAQGYQTEIYLGTMQKHLDELNANDVDVTPFYEPDLNSMLSAMCFIVDERVFNKTLYPDYTPTPLSRDATTAEFNLWGKNDEIQYAKWVEKIGGAKNLFLRTFLSDKRLA